MRKVLSVGNTVKFDIEDKPTPSPFPYRKILSVTNRVDLENWYAINAWVNSAEVLYNTVNTTLHLYLNNK